MLALLSICLSLALFAAVGAQKRFCLGKDLYPNDTLFPVLLCTEDTIRYFPNSHEQVVLVDPLYHGCGNIVSVYNQIEELEHNTRQKELSHGITIILQYFCLLPVDQQKVSVTIKDLASKNNRKIEL